MTHNNPAVIDDDQQGLINYVAGVIETKAGFSFAPWTVGGAFPFYRPKWVSSFEAAEGWSYVEGLELGWLLLGPGCVFLDAEKGQALWHQFQAWSREAQGGVLQKKPLEDGTPIFIFRPDMGRFNRVKAIVVPRPALKVVERPVEIIRAAR